MQNEDYHKQANSSLLDNFDELTRQLGQAQGVLNAISCEDQFKTISSKSLSFTLWSISDNVDRALESARGMMKSQKMNQEVS